MEFDYFLDTDVIIDFLTDRQPYAESSSIIFDWADKGELKLCASALCINNVHYVIRKIIGKEKVLQVLGELTEMVDVLPVTNDNIKSALSSGFGDFEDAIQHSVAMDNERTKAILTRNTKDYKKSKLPVFTPDTFVKMKLNEG